MKHNSIPSAGTEAPQSDTAEVSTSSQPCGNTFVVCSQKENCRCEKSDWLTFVEWAALIGWLVVVVLIFS